MDQLRKVYLAIKQINTDKHSPWWAGGAYAPISRKELETYFGSDGVPTCCPFWFALHAGRQDYFLANEGPEPTDYPELLVYERAGNHGSYRHLLVEGCFWVVTEGQWQAMRKDRHYVPNALEIPIFRYGFK
jgi:hypothetical protein